MKKFFFKKKYRKSMLSFFIAIKFQKLMELSLILKLVERTVAHMITDQCISNSLD